MFPDPYSVWHSRSVVRRGAEMDGVSVGDVSQSSLLLTGVQLPKQQSFTVPAVLSEPTEGFLKNADARVIRLQSLI